MPSRVIRGEINSSRSLSRVSMEADLTFRALIVAVDDYGRIDARPEMLKAALFPTRPEVTPAKVMKWLQELEAEGCVQLYTVDGAGYLCLTSWEKHRGKVNRTKKSRFPEPPGISGRLPESPSEGMESGVEGMESRVSPDKPATPPPAPAWAFSLSELLIEKVRGSPGGRIPPRARQSWAVEIAKLASEVPELANGKPPDDMIRAAIEWLFGPENSGQYALVVRSGASLREKWPRIVAAAQRVRARDKPAEDFERWVATAGGRIGGHS